jgi:hypothetical protein
MQNNPFKQEAGRGAGAAPPDSTPGEDLFDFFMVFNILTPLVTSTSFFVLFTSEANM